MGQLPFWHSVDLSAGGRPILREKEVDVLVENSIGLYQGKSKILHRQNGRIYLTSQRLIYVDNVDAKQYSLSIELVDVKKLDYSAKFLKSSPKITVFFKDIRKGSRQKQRKIQKPIFIKPVPWICPICSYSNTVQSNINPNNMDFLPVCDTCGIKATPDLIKSALKSSKSNASPYNEETEPLLYDRTPFAPKQIACPTCTFLNHPSLRSCELCGTILPINQENGTSRDEVQLFDDRIKIATESDDGLSESSLLFMKLSFHKNGDKFFLQKLYETLETFKWEIVLNSGNANKDAIKLESSSNATRSKALKHTDSMFFGIHSLAQLEERKTRKNEEIINSSLDDLQTLLNKANEILELTESFKKLNPNGSNESITPTINQVTRELSNDSNNESQKFLYLQEVARQLSDFLINDGILDEEGGIITLLDLYALFNRGRVGINLISPDELFKSCEYFPILKLPLIFKKINNVLVVQDSKFGDNTKIVNDIKKFIETFGDETYGFKYSNILKISDSFNWSITITEEILKIGLNMGDLVIDQQISGKFYFINHFKRLDSFNEKRYGTEEVVDQVVDDNNDGNDNENNIEVINNELNLPIAPTYQPFPEAPTYNIQKQNTPINNHKSKSLLQLEGLQF